MLPNWNKSTHSIASVSAIDSLVATNVTITQIAFAIKYCYDTVIVVMHAKEMIQGTAIGEVRNRVPWWKQYIKCSVIAKPGWW